MPSPSSSSSTRTLYIICLILVALGLLAAGYMLAQRVRAEASSKAVDIVMDYNEMSGLSGLEGVPLQDVLTRMKGAGATAVALQEETINDLARAGELTIYPFSSIAGTNIPLKSGWNINDTYAIYPHSAEATSVLRSGLARVYPPESLALWPQGYLVQGDPGTVSELGLGLSPQKVKQIRTAGLRVVPRLRGGAGISMKNLPKSLADLAQLIGASQRHPGVVVFDGTTIPGYRTLIGSLKDDLQQNGLTYGAVEFAKQKGDPELGAKLQGQLVRVHSISLEELSTLKPEEAVQRFGLAVKDRNIRVLYVHLAPVTSEDPDKVATDGHPKLDSAALYVDMIQKEVRAQGFIPATGRAAHPFNPLHVPKPVLALIFAGAGAGLLLWLLSVLPAVLPVKYLRWGYAVLVIGLLGAAGTALVDPSDGRKLFGLIAAIGFPMLALTWVYRKLDDMPRERRHPLLVGIGALVVATLITLAGGLSIGAMMSDSLFLVKVGQFTGVKATLALPLLFFALMIITDGVAKTGETFQAYADRVRVKFQEFMNKPIFLWGIVVGLVALVALGLMIARSGNDSGVGVSNLELKFRAVLDQWLVARPRTKEFGFGHPLFLFSFAAAARGYRLLALILMLGAAIGQADVLNTYCHAHTPLLMSLLRTANGLWLGIIIGSALLLIFARQALRRK